MNSRPCRQSRGLICRSADPSPMPGEEGRVPRTPAPAPRRSGSRTQREHPSTWRTPGCRGTSAPARRLPMCDTALESRDGFLSCKGPPDDGGGSLLPVTSLARTMRDHVLGSGSLTGATAVTATSREHCPVENVRHGRDAPVQVTWFRFPCISQGQGGAALNPCRWSAGIRPIFSFSWG